MMMKLTAKIMMAPAMALSTAASAAHGQPALFPKGELSTTRNHTGDIWLKELNVGDDVFDPSIAVADYGPGAKLDWHVHPGGQVLVITQGTGYYQEKGKPARLVHKGDVIKSAPGVEHWHGATPNSDFSYFAVTPTQKGKTLWLKPVTPAEYDHVAAQ